MIDLEEKVLRALEFSCHHVSPIPFIDRYLRLLGIDQDDDEDDLDLIQIANLAIEYSMVMQRSPSFLKYRPSQIAAASVLCAINISVSSISVGLNLSNICEIAL